MIDHRRRSVFAGRVLPALAFAGMLIAGSAGADITPLGGSFAAQSNASTTAPTGANCSDPDGGVGIAMAASACADGVGSTSAASSRADHQADFRGADFSLRADAGATASDVAGPFQATGNASSSANALESWTLGAPTYFTLARTVDPQTDGALTSANASVSFSGSGAASGLLPPGTYSLTANVDAGAVARRLGPTTGAAAATATARLVLAEADSPTLVRGTVLAEGVGRPGLLVEAFSDGARGGGAVLIDSTWTGDDGGYLLPAVTAAVTLRISDPSGTYETVVSPVVTAPDAFDADLPAAPVAVPTLDGPFVVLLVVALAAAFALLAWRR